MASKVTTFRAELDQLERWRAAAEQAGYSFSEFIKAALDSATEVVEGAPPHAVDEAFSQRAAPRRRNGGSGKRARTQTCEHRIPAGAYCKRCD